MLNLFSHPQYDRRKFLAIWVACTLAIATALYMQYQMDLIPCALCMTQRIFVIAVGVVALIAWLHHSPSKTRTYAITGMIFALIGAGFSIRHVWLQNLPADLAPACGPSLAYLLETVPLMEALAVLLQGDGNCAQSVWSFLGLTIPAWTLAIFIGFFVMNGSILWRTLGR